MSFIEDSLLLNSLGIFLLISQLILNTPSALCPDFLFLVFCELIWVSKERGAQMHPCQYWNKIWSLLRLLRFLFQTYQNSIHWRIINFAFYRCIALYRQWNLNSQTIFDDQSEFHYVACEKTNLYVHNNQIIQNVIFIHNQVIAVEKLILEDQTVAYSSVNNSWIFKKDATKNRYLINDLWWQIFL